MPPQEPQPPGEWEELANDDEDFEDDDYFTDEEDYGHDWSFEGRTALKFLLAGGVAGAGKSFAYRVDCSSFCNGVSRTCTAPFDRLKIFLITRPPDLGGPTLASKPSLGSVKVISSAVSRIYSEGGVRAFWTGNGLSVAKIFPESAIKFFAYESSVSLSRFSRCLIVFNPPFSGSFLRSAETHFCQVLGSCR